VRGARSDLARHFTVRAGPETRPLRRGCGAWLLRHGLDPVVKSFAMIDPETPVAELGERELLRYLRARLPAGEGVVIGVGGDAALVETSGQTLVSSDSLVERVHFRREWSPPRLLGRKALSVNLSDIAAMAGIPRHAVVSLCLPPDTPMGFLEGLYDGLLER